MYLCSSCKISQNIYIFSSDTEIQSKNGDLKFGNKHLNFTQMAIPSQYFMYISTLCTETPYKNYIPRMYIVCCITLATYGCTTVRNEILVKIYSGLKFGDAAKNNAN